MEKLPLYIYVVFILTTFLTIFLFFKATQKSIKSLIVLIAWLGLQSILAAKGFYAANTTLPPRFLLLVGPPLLFIILLFSTKAGRDYINNLNIKWLTLLHIVRIPVELVLLWLSIYKVVPDLMTFEGRNFDIISGITAPLVYYWGFVKYKMRHTLLIVWNIACLALLFNIVINAILSTPYPFQQFAFDQPNIALFYFPFVWLPCCIVPLVLFSHLVTIRQLILKK